MNTLRVRFSRQHRHADLLILVWAIALVVVVPLPVVDVAASGGNDPPHGFGQWVPQGPAPAEFGQIENVPNVAGVDNDEVTGAVHTVLAHPTQPGTLYIGAVNGGIWRTTTAHTTNVVWHRLTDDQASNSIGAMDFDPNNRRQILAGYGRFSSFARIGGALAGLIYTLDAGHTWHRVNGGGVLIDKNISGVAMRGSTFVVSANSGTPNNNENRGVFRSTDCGETCVRVSREDMAFGLPAGVAFDLVGDPRRQHRLFVPITLATGGPNGIYRSDDTGATWTKVSDAAIDEQLAGTVVTNVELAVGRHNNVYVAIARSGRLSSVFRSGDGGATWTLMSIPITPGTVVQQGIHPGGQASIHMSIVADKLNRNIVYLAGDRQPDQREENGSGVQFPNAIGARNYSGRVFRGDASQPLASQWSHMTSCRPGGLPSPHCTLPPPPGSPPGTPRVPINVSFMPNGGTANASSPHADSREMVMDAHNELIEVDDGGIYRRAQPQTNEGDWFSLNGNLQVTEQHSLAYDSLSKVALSGNQDTGTPIQLTEDGLTWESLLTADGGDVIADHFSTPGLSIRYTSFQFLGLFIRTFWDASNLFLSGQTIPMNPVVTTPPTPRPSPQFYTPIEVNSVAGNRILIGAANGLYESASRGDLVARIDLLQANGLGLDTLAYGATNNPDAVYMGAGNFVRVRLLPPPAPLVPSTNLGSGVVGVAMHPNDANLAFAATNLGVFMTTNGGGTWTDITGNLQALNPLSLRTLTFVTSSAGNAVVVGSLNGAYSATAPGFTTWQRTGTALPTVPVYELKYSSVDDVLVAGTLGRGAFKLRNASAVLTGGLP